MMRTLGGKASEPKKVKTITRHPTDARLGDAEPYGSKLGKFGEVLNVPTPSHSGVAHIWVINHICYPYRG